MRSDGFRKAVEAMDLDGALAHLSPSVVLHSPVTFKPFEGKEAVTALFTILFRTFEDFRYVGAYASDAGEVLHFRTRVGDREVEGLDLIRFGDSGLIHDLTVMVRPRSGLEALLAEVAPRLASASSDDPR